MKTRYIFLIFLVFIFSCEWDVLEPTDGELTFEVIGVQITFQYDDEEIIVFNKNWESARVEISRRDSHGNYVEIFSRFVSGRREVVEKAFFQSGDQIKVRIKIRDENNKEIIRESFFELG